MTLTQRWSVNVMALAACAILSAELSPANATVLTFEGTGTNINIPNTFGDNIAAAETGISVVNGTTPNIDLTWSSSGGTWQFYNDAEWTGAAQLDNFQTGNQFDLTFTPDAGFGVNVDSFVFDDYAGFAAGNTFDWTLFQNDAAGPVIASGSEVTANGQNLAVATGMGAPFAGPVLLRIEDTTPGGSGADQAVDSISFTQAATPVGPLTGFNLIDNPDAETPPTTPNGVNLVVPLWDDAGPATQQEFNLDWWGSNAPGPEFGNAFFYGGPNNAQSTLTDLIDVSALAASIDSGEVTFDLAGFFGGWQGQDDNATLTATFLDDANQTLGSTTIGGFLAADRGSQSIFLPDSDTGLLPANTRSVELTLTFTRTGGGFNDGTADNLSFVLTGPAPIPEPATATLTMLGLGGCLMRRRRQTA